MSMKEEDRKIVVAESEIVPRIEPTRLLIEKIKRYIKEESK